MNIAVDPSQVRPGNSGRIAFRIDGNTVVVYGTGVDVITPDQKAILESTPAETLPQAANRVKTMLRDNGVRDLDANCSSNRGMFIFTRA